MYKRSVSTQDMSKKKKNRKQLTGGAEKGKGQGLDDLVITDHHSAAKCATRIMLIFGRPVSARDMSNPFTTSVCPSGHYGTWQSSCQAAHQFIYLFIRLPKLTKYGNIKF